MYSKKTFFNNEKKQKNEKYKKDIGLFIKNDMHDIIKDNNIETYGKKNKMNTEEVYMQVQNKDEKVYIKKEDFESIKKGKEIEQEIKMIKKMKIAELQAFAVKHNIDIYENSKKKLKKVLMEEIIQTIK